MSKNKITLILLILGSFSCKSYYHFVQGKATNARISAAPDTSVNNLIFPYKESLDAKMNGVLAKCPVTLNKDKPESTLTNWVSDAIYHQASMAYSEPIAFAFTNYGGIRIPELSKGDITLGKIFELMPFDNIFVLVKINGTDLQKFLNYIAESGGSSISSSLRFTIDGKKAINATVDNKPIQITGQYYIGLSDYIANGGDNQTYLKNLPRIDKNILIRDMLAKEAKEKGLIEATLDQRISIIK